MPDFRKAVLHINGIVQGVGFRPFIFTLANHFHLNGWVRNTSAGVDIEVDGNQEVLDQFIAAIRSEAPPLARVDSIETNFSVPGGFTTFQIIESEEVEGAFQPISPDVSICPDCLRELFDPKDRRYHYPFINCTNCGPRFTIITDIPYDRPNTTMAPYAMCPDCSAEYNDPLNRRFHAQPVACPRCGPQVWLEIKGTGEFGKSQIYKNDAIEMARQLLAIGKILAIKGLGGFHLACDATNKEAVVELRRRKLRVDKPFALMMFDTDSIEKHCALNISERTLLESRQRPIILLERKKRSPIVEDVAPGQNTLGVMLPYSPLHYLLLYPGESVPVALVMTSGNLSEEPIATDNDEARLRLHSLADAFLMHDRDIHTRCDDSVVREFEKRGYPLRRSRGFAPDSIKIPFDVPPILATGPELKNTFCLTRERYAFISHHIGDMENYETLRSFEDGITHFERLFRIHPEIISSDRHPDYLSTRYASERAQREGLPIIGVQHHHAHIAACMADNGLTGDQPVIGIAFDGTGYGDDGSIWGGEYLLCDYAGYKRAYHLDYFPLPGGDAAIKRPARTALALLWALGFEWETDLSPVANLVNAESQALRVQLEHSLNTVPTSSLGRLFDAGAALVGMRQQVNYEAQAAIEFEAVIEKNETGAYPFDYGEGIIKIKPLITALLTDIRKKVPIPIISARFHNGIVGMIRQVCANIHKETGLHEVVLSGGVWQNMILLTRAVHVLRRDNFTVYIHNQVPTNDGGISFGQAVIGAVCSRSVPK